MLLHATAAAALSAAAKQRRRRSALGLATQCVASPPRPDPVVVEQPAQLRVALPHAPAYERTPAGGVRAALRRRTSAQRERAPRRHVAVPETGAVPPPAGRVAEAHAPAQDVTLPVASAGRVDGKKTACPTTQAQMWEIVREEASREAKREPFLASFLYSSVLAHASLPACLAGVLANKLGCSTLPATQLASLFGAAYAADAQLRAACHADLQAVLDRDPACTSYVQCLLFFKGFQALQSHRLAHSLWAAGRKPLALALQSRVSEAFHVDVHPAARIGPGLLLDHATGIVIGETAVVGANVSLLHHVTLGGTGAAGGDRHPKLGDGVLLGAGVAVLGPVRIGDGAKVGAGSVVMSDIPARCTAVGVPARVVLRPRADDSSVAGKETAADAMDQCGDLLADWIWII